MSHPIAWSTPKPTGVLVLADGLVITGTGLGATGSAEAEVCFNTAITGYQEILTDPSYAGQIITFTFPHIGNVGINDQDIESLSGHAAAVGAIFRTNITKPSNYRAQAGFDAWLAEHRIIALSGVDTRALTSHIRDNGLANAVICHDPAGAFDLAALKDQAARFKGLAGANLALDVTCKKPGEWRETAWRPKTGYANLSDPQFHIVAVDFGIKRNILRLLADLGCRVTILPATTDAEQVLAENPDGIFLSNGPGDPEATGTHAVPMIHKLIDSGIPLFGICLGHQMLALALGGKTVKMHQGHHGANHPVRDHTTGKVEIVSMNHGFAVDGSNLPKGVKETHISLFDGSNCGLKVDSKPVFSVQHHPEASPGPQDSHYLFRRFVNLIRDRKGLNLIEERA